MEMRTEGPIKTRREGAILEVTLDRPKANAIDLKTSRVMGLVFRDFRDDDSLRVCILRAEGEKFFCPGWDLKAAADGDAVEACDRDVVGNAQAGFANRGDRTKCGEIVGGEDGGGRIGQRQQFDRRFKTAHLREIALDHQ